MIHSCVEAHIDDISNTTVEIQESCCCNPVNIYTVELTPVISIVDDVDCIYSINDVPSGGYVYMETVGGADITLDWVCGTDYSVNYLKVTPTETVWISIDYSVDYDIRSNTDWIVQ